MDEISYLLKPGTYYVDASIGDESLEDVEITVSAGANTRKIVFAAEETRSKDHSKDDSLTAIFAVPSFLPNRVHPAKRTITRSKDTTNLDLNLIWLTPLLRDHRR
ncbi:MAG: hypothetical protein GXX05_02285 [Firmicutes bacterium]|nr:hypothetical protein [Bacillota bacterium]